MEARSFNHSGFTFNVAGEVLPALVLTHLAGKDLRLAGRLMERFFLDLLMAAQAKFGAMIQQDPEALSFQVKASEKLVNRLAEALHEVPTPIYLVSRKPKVEALVRHLLPPNMGTVQVLDSHDRLRHLPPGGLVLIDGLCHRWDTPLPAIQGLDHLVVRTLVSEVPSRIAEPWLQEQFIPVYLHSRKDITRRQEAARRALTLAIEAAEFSRYYQRCCSSHVRWQTHLELEVTPGTQRINAVLHFDGEDRVLIARDLKREIPWGQIPTLRFADVHGLQSTKDQLQEYLDWLKDPGGEPGVRACVLSGAPGTGKSHVCEAAAGEAGTPCILMGASEFLSQWNGETERIIRETLASLRQYDAAVIVIDEFDSIAWARGQTNEWSASYQSSIIGTLLRSVDLLRKGPGRVLMLTTTNQYDRIDPALVRSLRMGDHIHVGLPTAEDRCAILRGLLKGSIDESMLAEVAAMTTGLSPADLVQAVDHARRSAGRASVPITSAHITEALFDLRRGALDPSRQLSPDAKKRVAIHEAGHALLAYYLLGPDSIDHLSVIPAASGSLGSAYLHQADSLELPDAKAIKNRLTVLMGGRVAEGLCYSAGGASCGAENDIREATRLAQQAVGNWGLDPEFPLLSMEALPLTLQQALAPTFLARVQAWVKEAEVRATEELGRHHNCLNILGKCLMDAETLHRVDFLKILEEAPPSPHATASML